MSKAVVVSEQLAGKLLDKWRDILKLNDWKIRLDLVTSEEMSEIVGEDGFNTYGAVDVTSTQSGGSRLSIYAREAQIVVNKSIITSKIDLESTIVHELLHIVLCYLVPYKTDLEVTKTEQLITTLENALVRRRSRYGTERKTKKASSASKRNKRH